jgi:hypothetical protein
VAVASPLPPFEMPSMRPRMGLALLCCTMLANVAWAQDSVPRIAFHRGQWGAQFSFEDPFTGLGALFFTSPRSAWTLNAALAFSATTSSVDLPPGTRESNVKSISLSLDLGRRWYGVTRGRAIAFYGVGATGGYRQDWATVDTVEISQHTWRAGLFGELGAQVHVTPYLSLGAAWPLRAQVSRAFDDRGARATSWTISGTTLRLQGALYF